MQTITDTYTWASANPLGAAMAVVGILVICWLAHGMVSYVKNDPLRAGGPIHH